MARSLSRGGSLVLLACCVSAACAGLPVRTADLTADLPAGSGGDALPVKLTGAGLAGLQVRLFDGQVELRTGVEEPLAGTWRRQGDTLRWAANQLDATLTLRQAGRLAVADLRLAAAREPVWLRVEARLPFAYEPGWRAFDGRSERPGQTGRIDQWRPAGTFPAVAAYDGRGGVGLGLSPGCWVSDFRLAALSSNGRHGALTVTVPLVVEAGKPETLTFAVARFESGPFGYRPLLERWHDGFPTAYRPAADLDPRLLAACAADCRDAAAVRAAGCGWAWLPGAEAYPGDFTARLLGGEVGPVTAGANLSASIEEAERVGHLASVAGLATWIDGRLRERFADSLIAAEDAFDDRGVTVAASPSTATSRAFWAGNSLADRRLTDLSPPWGVGYGLQDATGGARYRPRRYLPGRAYDERGPWIAEELGQAHLCRAVHRLRRKSPPHRVGTVVEPAAELHYALAAETDVVIGGQPVYQTLADPGAALRQRLLLGARSRCWTFQLTADDLAAQVDAALAPAALREVLRSRWDTAILWCLRFGWLPSPDLVLGYAPARRAAPVIADCVRAGWHPVSAMTSTQPLWLARYGAAFDTRLVVMNPHDSEAVRTAVRVHSAFLDGATYLFANADGSVTSNQLQGADTLLDLKLPPRSWSVFVPVGQHAPGEETMAVRTQPRYDLGPLPDPGVVARHGALPRELSPEAAAALAVYERAGCLGHELAVKE